MKDGYDCPDCKTRFRVQPLRACPQCGSRKPTTLAMAKPRPKTAKEAWDRYGAVLQREESCRNQDRTLAAKCAGSAEGGASSTDPVTATK